MHKSEIHEGNTIVTSATRSGVSVTGKVTSTRGPVKCKVVDANGKGWNVPYSMIIACSKDVEPVVIIKAVKGDVILTSTGAKYQVDKVNSARYSATRLSDGKPYYIYFHSVVEILDVKKNQRDAQKAYLMSKGFTAEDVAEFEKLFPTNP